MHEFLDKISGKESDRKTINELVSGHLREVVTNDLLPLLSEFREERMSISPTFRFWNDFLTRVMLPFKLFLSSTRLGLWDVHQYAKAELLPLMFASNRSTYARYMSYQIFQMQFIPVDVISNFKEGLFAAKLSEGRFNSVWIDYVLEATENKALKGSGGIIGLTLEGNALARWFLARPVTAKYSMAFHKYVCQNAAKSNQSGVSHHSDTNAAQKRYDSDIKKMTQMFDGRFIDPFDLSDPSTHLTNFATGVVTSSSIQNSLLDALDKGNEMAKTLMKERFIKVEGQEKPRKSFYDPLPKPNVKTMADMQKTVKVKTKSVVMNGEVMYLRLLAVNSFKKVPSEKVLSVENAQTP